MPTEQIKAKESTHDNLWQDDCARLVNLHVVEVDAIKIVSNSWSSRARGDLSSTGQRKWLSCDKTSRR